MRLLIAALLTVAFHCATSVAQAPTQRTPTVDDLISIERITELQISPDARWIVYGVSSADFEKDAFVTHLWLANTQDKSLLQLTHGEASASNMKWSPDNAWIAFSSAKGEEKAQIHLIRPNGGESFPITELEDGIETFQWSPDGKMIAFSAKPPKTGSAKDRAKYFSEYTVVRRDYRPLHLFTVDIAAAIDKPQKGQQRTKGTDLSVGAFTWSPDGTRIAFDAAINPDLVNNHTRDIYLLTLEGDAVQKIVENVGPDNSPVWSPDGTRIAYSTVPDRREYFPYNQRIAVAPANGGTPRIITGAFDEHAIPIAWEKDGVYFVGLRKMAVLLYRVDPDSAAIEQVSQPDEIMGRSFSVSKDATAFAFASDTPHTAGDLFIHRAGESLPVALTDMTARVRDLNIATREVIHWQSEDGAEIEGVLHKPRNFDPNTRYPLLLIIHGGPTGTDRPGLLQGIGFYPSDIWTSRGALILRVNYRGSGGYGEAFRTLNLRNLGVGDAWDVLSGVDYLIDQGWVDPKRIGCMGWSQGGYISAYLATNSDRFAAFSVGAGVSNWYTYYYNTDITPFTINYLGADPASDPEIYAKTNPMAAILQAKTPTLIQHGDKDARVPIANAYELRQGLEDRGVPVTMIVYNGFAHNINKPKGQRAVLQHNLDWFNHYLWGDDLPDWIEPDVPEDESAEDAEKK